MRQFCGNQAEDQKKAQAPCGKRLGLDASWSVAQGAPGTGQYPRREGQSEHQQHERCVARRTGVAFERTHRAFEMVLAKQACDERGVKAQVGIQIPGQAKRQPQADRNRVGEGMPQGREGTAQQA